MAQGSQRNVSPWLCCERPQKYKLSGVGVWGGEGIGLGSPVNPQILLFTETLRPRELLGVQQPPGLGQWAC